MAAGPVRFLNYLGGWTIRVAFLEKFSFGGEAKCLQDQNPIHLPLCTVFDTLRSNFPVENSNLKVVFPVVNLICNSVNFRGDMEASLDQWTACSPESEQLFQIRFLLMVLPSISHVVKTVVLRFCVCYINSSLKGHFVHCSQNKEGASFVPPLYLLILVLINSCRWLCLKKVRWF